MRAIAILLLLALPAHAEVAPGCQSAMEQALSGYAGCRLLALSKDTRRPDPVKLAGSLAACAARFEAAAYKALGRYGTGSCPPTSVAQFRAYIEGLADGASAAAGGEALPDVAPCLATPVPTATPSPACTPYSVDNGKGGTYTNRCDGTITDSTSGLTWEVKSTDGGIHDVFNVYTFTAGFPNFIFDGTVATLFLARLNCTGNFAGGAFQCAPWLGKTDWRLPTVEELSGISFSGIASGGIVDTGVAKCGLGSPCINPVFGPTLPSEYWSSSSNYVYWGGRWVVDFGTGKTAYYYQNPPISVHARAVRSEVPPPTPTPSTCAVPTSVSNGKGGWYTDNCNGTVTDSTTGLIWERKTGYPSQYTKYCEDLAGCPDPHDVNSLYKLSIDDTSPWLLNGSANTAFLTQLNTPPCFAGSCSWRIPTIEELAGGPGYGPATGGIVDTKPPGCGVHPSSVPCINEIFGPTWASCYASSSSSTNNRIWGACFSTGSVGGDAVPWGYFFLRAVRTGP
ncbi:MAG: hypothetical protein RL698_2372 [Pseudomonadota bacterium]